MSRHLSPGDQDRAKIARGHDDDATGIQLIGAKRQDVARIGQVLDDVEEDDRIHLA